MAKYEIEVIDSSVQTSEIFVPGKFSIPGFYNCSGVIIFFDGITVWNPNGMITHIKKVDEVDKKKIKTKTDKDIVSMTEKGFIELAKVLHTK